MPDKRKQQGAKALTVGDGIRDVFMGVVAAEEMIAVLPAAFPSRRAGSQKQQ